MALCNAGMSGEALWEFTVTGCGTSHGCPMWGAPALWSSDPRDRRRRSGAFLRGPQGQILLFDCGPDLAHQLTDPYRDWDGVSYPSRCITRCDGVLITHDHADHTHGINDLRHLNRLMRGRSIPLYGHNLHLEALRRMFAYCFADGDDLYAGASPALRCVPLADGQPVEIAGLVVVPFPMSHGTAGRSTGWRCGRLAYCTDIKELPASSERWLSDLDLLVLGVLRDAPHPTHQCWDEALALLARCRPRRALFVHLGPEVRYREWAARAPAGVEIAYDGWTTRVAA